MSEKIARDAKIPDWYLETFQAIQRIEGGLRNAENVLLEAMDTGSLDKRVRCEMQGVLDALHGIKGNLVLVDSAAREVLDQTLSDAA
jgi:hypothetical protein